MRAESRTKLTYDDFLLFPDDGKRHELIDGEHYVTPSPNLKHQSVLGNLYLLIGNWLREHRAGRVMLSPFDVVFTEFDVVEPDLSYLSNERAAQVIKRRLYERSGVSEYCSWTRSWTS
jgi:Uma2 family endonuclease